MTGIAGGGHALWLDGASGRVELLDFFVAVPGSGAADAASRSSSSWACPSARSSSTTTSGVASCAVPGRSGRPRPALAARRTPSVAAARRAGAAARAAQGVAMPPAHASCLAMLAPVMTMREGGAHLLARRPPARGGRPAGAARARARARGRCARKAPGSFYEGTLAEALLALMEERGGLLTRDDLEAYEATLARARGDRRTRGRGSDSRGGLAQLVETLGALPRLRGCTEADRAVALAERARRAAVQRPHATSIRRTSPSSTARATPAS